MGVTIYCKKTKSSIDMGYGGFNNLRNKVAELAGGPFYPHYLLLSEPRVMFVFDEKRRKQFFEDFDKRTAELIETKQADIKIVDFLLQPDCGGKIRYGACKNILKAIGDYDDDVLYGYCGRPDCAKFVDFKQILQECVDTKSDLVWD
ncbi:MAG: hypothetical protein UH542_06185 [Bacteroidales bacterium]|nr:hypothetical protein [Bacteroidales bacterium]